MRLCFHASMRVGVLRRCLVSCCLGLCCVSGTGNTVSTTRLALYSRNTVVTEPTIARVACNELAAFTARPLRERWDEAWHLPSLLCFFRKPLADEIHFVVVCNHRRCTTAQVFQA